MDRNEEYRRIFDFFFSGIDVPETLKEEFLAWLDVHGNEPETRRMLEEYWHSVEDESPEFDMTAGLERLMASLRKENSGPRRRMSGRKTLTWIIGIAAAAAVFAAGWFVSDLTGGGKETVLMASSENVSSYSLPDGSKVWLNKDSWLSFRENYGRSSRKVTLNGEGFFEVSRDVRRPFVVKMSNGMNVKVLGTEFNVCTWKDSDDAEIILRSGSVQILDADESELALLKPDQKFTWTGGNGVTTSVNASDCCRWYERRLSFDNVKLCDIVDNMAHKYRMQITLNVGRLADKRMSLTVRDESVNEIMDVLSSLLPVSWRLDGNEIIIENKTKKH